MAANLPERKAKRRIREQARSYKIIISKPRMVGAAIPRGQWSEPWVTRGAVAENIGWPAGRNWLQKDFVATKAKSLGNGSSITVAFREKGLYPSYTLLGTMSNRARLG